MKKVLFYLYNLMKFCILHRETTQHNTTQHNTTQHNTTQLNNIRLSKNKESLLQAFCLQ